MQDPSGIHGELAISKSVDDIKGFILDRAQSESRKNGLGTVGREVTYTVIEDLGEYIRVGFDIN